MSINRQYHYFISGLPDLSFEDSKPWILPSDFGKVLKEELHQTDYIQIELILLEYDNLNLTSYLISGEMAGDKTGNYSVNDFKKQEELFSYEPSVTEPPVKDILPAYMVEVIREKRKKKEKMNGLSVSRKLTEGYYHHIMRKGSNYLKTFTRFEFYLRNLVTFIKAGMYDICQQTFIMGDSDHAKHLRANAGRSLVKDHEFELFDQIVSFTGTGSFYNEEIKYDRLRWKVIEDLIFFEDFNIDRISAYLQQLIIMSRWAELSKDTGEDKLRQILSDASHYVQENSSEMMV